MNKPTLAMLAGVAACAATLVLWLDDDRGPTEPGAGRSAADARPVARSSDASMKITDMATATVQEEAARAGAPYTLQPPYVIVDAITFATEGGVPTRLAAVAGPAAEAVCTADDGRLWACGLQGRAALNNLVRGQAVACTTATQAAETGDGRRLIATCRVGDTDLASAMVASGFARAVAPTGGLAAVEASARREAKGLWAGGWSIRP